MQHDVGWFEVKVQTATPVSGSQSLQTLEGDVEEMVNVDRTALKLAGEVGPSIYSKIKKNPE